MRWLVISLLAGCSFTPGTFSSSHDGDITGDDGPGSGSDDSMTQCTNHDLPPSVNVDATQWSAPFLTAPSWACDAAGTTTIDSFTGTATSDTCQLGTVQITNDVTQTSGAGSVLVVRLSGLSITNNQVLRLIGDKPIVLLVAGNVVVDSGGLIDAGAKHATPGAGGSRSGECTLIGNGLGGPGVGSNWGGGGGGFGTAGGNGGYQTSNGGSANGPATLQPLRGGCAGGVGSGSTAPGGAGGGAFEISASGTITIGGTGVANLSAAGGGGTGAASGGGSGGGSGGAILLVSPTLAALGTTGALRAHGGSGSAGCGSSCGGGNEDGSDGNATNNAAAVDTTGTPGGTGNDQGRRGGLASIVGTAALATTPGEMTSQTTNGRGAGGGGGGRLVVTTGAVTTACD